MLSYASVDAQSSTREATVAKTAPAFAVNERVIHQTYGRGTISAVNALHTTIEFDKDGRKKFLTSLVRLEPGGDTAPEPPPKRARAKKPSAKSKK